MNTKPLVLALQALFFAGRDEFTLPPKVMLIPRQSLAVKLSYDEDFLPLMKEALGSTVTIQVAYDYLCVTNITADDLNKVVNSKYTGDVTGIVAAAMAASVTQVKPLLSPNLEITVLQFGIDTVIDVLRVHVGTLSLID